MSMQIVSFQPEHLPDAAKPLADRHRRNRWAMAQLPRRFEDPSTARRAIDAVLARDHAHGFVAIALPGPTEKRKAQMAADKR